MDYARLHEIVDKYTTLSIEGGINYVFVVGEDYRELIAFWNDWCDSNKIIEECPIWKNHKGQFEIRLHR